MKIIYFEKLDSTNTFAKNNIENFEDKTIIVAHNQTCGHGRFNRSWIDFGNKNIFMTFILKPSDKIEPVYSNLTQYLSVCVCKEFENLNINTQIKWPNDILVNKKKIAGILAETVIKNNTLKGIVLGIGINVFATKSEVEKVDIPVTALNLEGVNIKKEILIDKISKIFFEGYYDVLNKGFCEIKEYYTSHAYIPENLKISKFNTTIVGNFKGFDNNGQLLIEFNNSINALNMGEIDF